MCWYWSDVSYQLCIDVNNADLYLMIEKPTKGGLKCLIWAVSHKSEAKIAFVARCSVVPIVKKGYHLSMVCMCAKTSNILAESSGIYTKRLVSILA